MTCGSVEQLEPPVVEDEQLHAAERAMDAGVAAVTAGTAIFARMLREDWKKGEQRAIHRATRCAA